MSGNKIPLFTKEIVRMDSDMVKESGLKVKQDIMEDIVRDLNKAMDNYISQVEIFIKAILFKIKNRVMEKCFGRIAVSIKENGNKGFKMEKDRYI